MDILEKAISLALEGHANQKDKGGMPYILHPLYVMNKMDTKDEMICAILHDIVEDTEITFEDLKHLGFSKENLHTLDCLTRKKDEDYFDYIERVKSDKTAVKIKLADLEHNMDFKRVKDLSDEYIIFTLKKYKKAWNELNKIRENYICIPIEGKEA